MGPGERRQIIYTIISNLSVFLAGACYGWFEPLTIRLLEPPISFTPEEVSWMVSVVEVAGVFSSYAAGELTNRFGRKYVILSTGLFCIAGWILVLISKSFSSLIIVRFLHGVATGIAFTVTPIYTAEIAEPRLRGRLSGTFQIALNLGNLYSFSTGPFLTIDDFACACLPLPIIFLVTFVFLPETPYYLLMTGREEEARKVLKTFRTKSDVEDELQSMKTAVTEEMDAKGSWRTLLFDKRERKAFIIVQIVCFAKYMTGITVIINYAMESFSKSESFLSPEEGSIVLAVFLVVVAIIPAVTSDCIGRKRLLLLSCFGSSLAHLVTGSYYYLLQAYSSNGTESAVMLYVGLLMYCFFADIGLGPLLLTLQSEMFGSKTRGIASGFTSGFSGVWCFIIIKLYTPVNERFGVYVNFWFYSAVGFLSGILLYLLMYETAGQVIGARGGKNLDESDQQKKNDSREENIYIVAKN